jgi:hypothetical protein
VGRYTNPVSSLGKYVLCGITSREHIFTRDETGLVYLPTQLVMVNVVKGGGRTHSPGGEGDGGVNFLEDERDRIALLQ